MARTLAAGTIFTAPALLEEAYAASLHDYIIVVERSSKPWIITVDRYGNPRAHTIPGPGQSTVRLDALSYPVAVVYAQVDEPFVEPHLCGHAERTPGCGGCDPGAIEFVREDGEIEYVDVGKTVEASAQLLDTTLMAYSRAEADTPDVTQAAAVLLDDISMHNRAGDLVASADLEAAIARMRAVLGERRSQFGDVTDAAADLVSRYYEATGRTSGGGPR